MVPGAIGALTALRVELPAGATAKFKQDGRHLRVRLPSPVSGEARWRIKFEP